ncbi:hypothetical protein Egran_02566, partial [Elaphomyces granulatus]
MSRLKQGVHSWEDVLTQRYQSTLAFLVLLIAEAYYHETIHIIYAANCFEFSNTWSLTYLHPTVPHEQWNDIRMLDLKWAFPGHWLPSKDPVKTIYVLDGRQQWVDTCKAIFRMKRLEHFTLHLTGNWFGEPVEKIPTFLEPLRGLRLKQTWKILLPAQPYYRNEIGRLNVILQKKGMDCLVREAENSNHRER